MREPSPRTRSSRPAALAVLALAALVAVVARPDPVAAGPGGWPWRPALADSDSVARGPTPPARAEPDELRLDTLDLPPVADTSDVTADTSGAAAPGRLAPPSAQADTTDADSLARARAYFPRGAGGGPGVSVVGRRLPGVRGRLGSYWSREVTLDTAAYAYRVRETVGGGDVRAPATVSLDEFLAARRRQAVGEQFRTLAAQRADRQTRGRGGLGFAVDIPGGDQGAFRTLFGKNEVALTVNGTSNVDLGVRYDQSDLQEARSRGDATPFAPDFGQELNLNVAGTIGDKLAINVNYDTQSQFDFENQVSLVYTGYEDDIIQRIEAGNVFLQTPATLIRGGQRLFGVRTDLQFGPLALTAVASQQDAESVDRVFEGGTDTQTFRIAPYDYEDATHFFLGYAFHNWWDRAHRQPNTPTLPPGLTRIVGVEVWKHEPGLVTSTNENVETTWAVALADLAEPAAVLAGGEAYLGPFNQATGRYPGENDLPGGARLPDAALDQYSDAYLRTLRTNGSTATVATVNTRLGGVERELPAAGAFANNVFRRLRDGVDYTADLELGWISLTGRLAEGDLLAVAYQYEAVDAAGQTRSVTVGDFGNPVQSAGPTGGRTVLKLLRADNPTPASPLWDLTLRNVYRTGGRSLAEPNFSLGVTFEPPGKSASELPPPDELSFGQRTFLEVLGLDRVNGQGLARPDDRFDFRAGVTVRPDNGRVVFPVRQPFGDYLLNLVEGGWTVGSIGTDPNGRVPVSYGIDRQAAVDRYVPTVESAGEAGGRATLYDLLPDLAERQLPRLSGYRITGEVKGGTQSVFNIGFQLVEGTVVVTSGGQPLQEGTDYRVNYSGGTVEIINEAYLQRGQSFQVSVEQNQLFEIGSKSLLGLRADLRLSEDFVLGATAMQLAERPLGDKFLIGEEALDNSIVGFDGAFKAEPRWLTRAVDALPLVQTRAPSRFEIRGEVARLSPGHPQTLAYDRTRAALRERPFADGGRLDFAEDELRGVSYIDAFEQSENAYTALGFTAGWRIAAAPTGAAGLPLLPGNPDADVTDPELPSNRRGLFTWYTLSRANYRAYGEAGLLSRATEPVDVTELFPQRPAPQGSEQRFLDLLDLYFDPTRRGPYNYSGELFGRFAQEPTRAWGGFVQAISTAYTNFDGQNNVEFVEMVFSPLGGKDGTEPVGPDAVMYLDLGRLNEDVVPNGAFNTEDGLISADAQGNVDNWSRQPSGLRDGIVSTNRDTGLTEDLGLDGLPSLPTLGGAEYPLSEVVQFRPFLDGLQGAVTPEQQAEERRAALDPSGDDYYYFTDPRFDDTARYPSTTRGATVQERFAHYLPAFEVNSALAQQNLVEGGGNGVAVQPNTEDINGDGQTQTTESFHRYRIPLTDAGLRASPFFQNPLTTTDAQGREQTWYLLRIPVRTRAPERTSVGYDDDDFSRIESARLWTTGHSRPVTLRFASFELVGSQWLKSEVVGFGDEPGDPVGSQGGEEPELFIESVNNEESGAAYAIPRGTIQNTSRAANGAIRATREQALVFRAEGLAEGRRAAIARSYNTRPLDLTKYSNVRMAVHGHGFDRRDNVRVFVRFGDDEGENYYEVEQPVYPFDPDRLVGPGGGPSAAFPACPALQPFNCARSDSLWQTNVGGVAGRDLNPVNVVVSELNRTKLERDRLGLPVGARYTVDGPEGAPPGATVTVRGQPSIQDVRTVVLGVRNGEGGAGRLDTVAVWFNELRASGYDEEGGASGFVTAAVTLADVAQLNARFSMTEDGFGDLGGTLGGRSFASQSAFTLQSSFNAHKLIPERFGWSIPVSFSATENGSTPRFDPDNGDVRLDDLVAVAREAEGGGGAAGGAVPAGLSADAILDRARTATSSRNVRVQVSKSGSRSPWLRYSLDGLTASYTLAAQDGSNPSNQLTSSDSWTGNVVYRVAPPKPLTVRPFGFAGSVPVLGAVLGGLDLNVLPSNVTLSADVARNLSVVQPRLGAEFLAEPDTVRAFRALARRNQRFDHGRQVDVGWRPFPFLQTSFASNVSQDLGAAGQRESFRILVRERDGGFSRVYDLSPVEARDTLGLVYRDLLGALDGFTGGPFPDARVEILGGADLAVLPVGQALGNAFGGEARTQSYTQRATASLRVSTSKVKWLSWLQLQPVSYSANYSWLDQPNTIAPDLDIARASTQAQVQTGARIVPRTFWRLFPFYRALEAQAGRGGPGGPAAPADSSGGGLRPLALARDVFLGLTAVDDVSVTYRGSATTAAGGLQGQAFSLFSGLTGDAPPLGYRLGLRRELGLDRRIGADPAFNVVTDQLGPQPLTDQFAAQHDVDARTQLSPLRGLSIGLNWRTAWSGVEETNYRIEGDGLIVPRSERRTGAGSSTVFAFGGGYAGVVARHADRYARDVAGAAADTVASEFRSPTGLATDFKAELARGLGGFGPNGLFTLPLPGWTVTYSGLERLPLLRSLADQVSLQHGYSATSETSVVTNTNRRARVYTRGGVAFAGEGGPLAGATGLDGFDEPTSVTVNERFQPLIGVTLGFKGGIQASLSTNRTSTSSLQAASSQIFEKTARDLRVDFSYARTGLRLFGLRGLNNNIRFQLTALVADDATVTRPFQDDVERAINGEPLAEALPETSARFQLSPQISYTVSNQVTASFIAQYERTNADRLGGQATRFNGGVSLRILFSN